MPPADRNVQVLTRHLGERTGTLAMSVRVGRVDRGALGGGRTLAQISKDDVPPARLIGNLALVCNHGGAPAGRGAANDDER